MGDFGQVSAECREMKHRWCYGHAWDNSKDMLGDCECNCHSDEQEDAA